MNSKEYCEREPVGFNHGLKTESVAVGVLVGMLIGSIFGGVAYWAAFHYQPWIEGVIK